MGIQKGVYRVQNLRRGFFFCSLKLWRLREMEAKFRRERLYDPGCKKKRFHYGKARGRSRKMKISCTIGSQKCKQGNASRNEIDAAPDFLRIRQKICIIIKNFCTIDHFFFSKKCCPLNWPPGILSTQLPNGQRTFHTKLNIFVACTRQRKTCFQ